MSRTGRTCAAVGLLLVGVGSARGQETSFEAIVDAVKAGQRIYVTEASGTKWSGVLVAASSDGISIRADVPGAGRGPLVRRDVQWSAADIIRVERDERDSLADGAVLGALAGAAAGYLWFRGSGGCDCTQGDIMMLVVAPFVAGGAAAGSLMDLATPRRTTVFQRVAGGAAAISIAPILTPSARGAHLSIGF
jgi:hypothetical protein